MRNNTDQASKRYRYPYLTEDVAARARTDELLDELIVAVVNAAADFDMFATEKTDAGRNDHESSYWYFRDILNKLGIPPQAIVDVIDECCPNDQHDNLTECGDGMIQASAS
jgi:hypothetical protein